MQSTIELVGPDLARTVHDTPTRAEVKPQPGKQDTMDKELRKTLRELLEEINSSLRTGLPVSSTGR